MQLGCVRCLAGDQMSQSIGQEFSTYDADHDTCSCYCAVTYQSAWWFVNCAQCDLNGVYNSTAGVGCQGVNWYYWKGAYYSLMKSEMKMRPSI